MLIDQFFIMLLQYLLLTLSIMISYLIFYIVRIYQSWGIQPRGGSVVSPAARRVGMSVFYSHFPAQRRTCPNGDITVQI